MTTDSNTLKDLGRTAISNPMDWKAIDRFILLACLVLLAPLSFGVSMWATNILAPEWLNQTLVTMLSVLYVLHIAVMASFILTAIKLRKYTHDWPLFENAIISSFLVTVMTTGYLTGTHLSEALLIIFLGVIITCTLADVNKIKFCFWIVVTHDASIASYAYKHVCCVIPEEVACSTKLFCQKLVNFVSVCCSLLCKRRSGWATNIATNIVCWCFTISNI